MRARQLAVETVLPTCVALVVASGRGERFGGDRPKQYLPLAGKPLLRHAWSASAGIRASTRVRAVIHPDDAALYAEAAGGLELLEPVPGGATRQESVRLGLESLAGDPPELVLIHDGVRPLVDAGGDRPGAARPAHARRGAAGAAGDRHAQARRRRHGRGHGRPHGPVSGADAARVRYDRILGAHRRFAGAALTDDAALAEAHGLTVALVAGDEDNLKITEPRISRAPSGCSGRHGGRCTGLGFDVHRLAPGEGLVLLGVHIPCPLRLLGHSDADVGLHALTDALLGTIGAGDIGSHFPPSEARWAGADSAMFLTHARDLVAAAGGRIEHVDVTLICEQPRIGPHRAAMVARVAELARRCPPAG